MVRPVVTWKLQRLPADLLHSPAIFLPCYADFRYDPYKFDISINGLKASTCLNNKWA